MANGNRYAIDENGIVRIVQPGDPDYNNSYGSYEEAQVAGQQQSQYWTQGPPQDANGDGLIDDRDSTDYGDVRGYQTDPVTGAMYPVYDDEYDSGAETAGGFLDPGGRFHEKHYSEINEINRQKANAEQLQRRQIQRANDLRAQDYARIGAYEDAIPMEQLTQEVGQNELLGQTNTERALNDYTSGQQQNSIDYMRDIYNNGGLTDADRARMQLAAQDAGARARGSREAMENRLAARGMNDSGAGLLGQMTAQQGANTDISNANLGMQIAAQDRSDQAAMSAAQLGNQLYSQQYGVAGQQDAFDQHNAQRFQQISDANFAAEEERRRSNVNNQRDVHQRNTQEARDVDTSNVEANKYVFENKQEADQRGSEYYSGGANETGKQLSDKRKSDDSTWEGLGPSAWF